MNERQSYHFSKIIISSIPTSKTNFIFNATYFNVNMYVPNSNFEGNFSTYMFCKSFWHYAEVKIYCCTSRHLISKKNIKLFPICGVLNSCRILKCLWSLHFSEFIRTNMLIGNDFFVFKYPFTCKKKFSISHYYYFN